MKLTREQRKIMKGWIDEYIRLLDECRDVKGEEERCSYYKCQIKEISEMLKTTWKISPDTLVTVGGSLLTVLLILNFEKLNIVSTKALGFIIKGRV